MKKLLGFIILAALCTTLLIGAAAATFTNPVASGADPYILNDNGTYYLYATTGDKYGYRVFSSTNLVEWEAHGYCLMAKELYWDPANAPSHYNAWAPEVIKYGDLYYMVYSIDEQIGIAVSDSPLGPFTNRQCPTPLIPEAKNIDGHFFLDDDGQMYLYFVSCGAYSKNGYSVTGGNNIWAAKFDMNTLTLDDASIKLLLRHDTNDVFDNAWGEKVHGIAEGPSVIKHEGTYYLTFSVGGYTQELYSVHCATSASPLGDFERDYDNIVLISDDVKKEDPTGAHLYGTAHHTFTQLSDGSWVIVYHAHRTGYTETTKVNSETGETELIDTVSPRVICIDKAYFENVEGGKDILRAGVQGQQTIVFTTKNDFGIKVKEDKTIKGGYPTAAEQEYIVGAPTRETYFEGTFASLATNENVIYVAHYDGFDTNAGTKEAPVKTIEKAAELLKTTGGHIIIIQDYINDTTLDIPAADAPLYIGGSKDRDILFSMKFIRVNSPVYFDNILLAPATANNNSLIVCNYNDVVFGDGFSSLNRTANGKFVYICPGAARYTGKETTNAAYIPFLYDTDDVLSNDKEFTVKVYNGTFEGIFNDSVRFASDTAIRELGTVNATVLVDNDVLIRPAKVTNLTGTADDSGVYTLTFDTVEGVEKYQIVKNGTVVDYVTEGTYVDTESKLGDDNTYSVRSYVNGCCRGDDVKVTISTIGDENGDGQLDIADVVTLIGKVTSGEKEATLMQIVRLIASLVK
ncbi:MAG: glycoside hydrolase family 43 protein [Clostridia bacterium]|nr:glycoside hydrolase family 43 protein [Clostridia bacterium]